MARSPFPRLSGPREDWIERIGLPAYEDLARCRSTFRGLAGLVPVVLVSGLLLTAASKEGATRALALLFLAVAVALGGYAATRFGSAQRVILHDYVLRSNPSQRSLPMEAFSDIASFDLSMERRSS